MRPSSTASFSFRRRNTPPRPAKVERTSEISPLSFPPRLIRAEDYAEKDLSMTFSIPRLTRALSK